MSGKKPVFVGGHLRSGVAIPDYVQMRDSQNTDGNTPSVNLRGKHSQQLGGMSTASTHELGALEWESLIEVKREPGPPNIRDAYFSDGELNIGKRQLIVSINHQFVSHHDDPATEKIEEIPSEFEARERYQLVVPDGAQVDYETISEAFRLHTAERFAPLIEDKTYGKVEVDSVIVQEWEVVPGDNPEKVWQCQREIWKGGELSR
jgi:hypothetical protein